jgi:hypothetical protein
MIENPASTTATTHTAATLLAMAAAEMAAAEAEAARMAATVIVITVSTHDQAPFVLVAGAKAGTVRLRPTGRSVPSSVV